MTPEATDVIRKIVTATTFAAAYYCVPAPRLRAHLWAESTWGEEGTKPALTGYDRHGQGIAQVDDRYHAFALDPLDKDILLSVCYEALFLHTLYSANQKDWHAASKAYNGAGPAADEYADKIEKYIEEEPWLNCCKRAGLPIV